MYRPGNWSWLDAVQDWEWRVCSTWTQVINWLSHLLLLHCFRCYLLFICWWKMLFSRVYLHHRKLAASFQVSFKQFFRIILILPHDRLINFRLHNLLLNPDLTGGNDSICTSLLVWWLGLGGIVRRISLLLDHLSMYFLYCTSCQITLLCIFIFDIP